MTRCEHKAAGTYCVGEVKTSYYYGVPKNLCEFHTLSFNDQFQHNSKLRERVLQQSRVNEKKRSYLD